MSQVTMDEMLKDLYQSVSTSESLMSVESISDTITAGVAALDLGSSTDASERCSSPMANNVHDADVQTRDVRTLKVSLLIITFLIHY